MRLDKFLAQGTGLSRAEVKKKIKYGQVIVDKAKVNDPARQINGEQVLLNGKPVLAAKARYLMLYKPAGYICATRDTHQATALDLIAEPHKEKLQIVGRLDKDTTGLVLMTDDGQWNHKITSPNRQCIKKYSLTVDKALTPALIDQFALGIQLKGENRPTRPATLRIIDKHKAEIEIQEGKYHQIKRMFAACGFHVEQLHRYQVGAIKLDKALQAGDYRFLLEEEVTSVD